MSDKENFSFKSILKDFVLVSFISLRKKFDVAYIFQYFNWITVLMAYLAGELLSKYRTFLKSLNQFKCGFYARKWVICWKWFQGCVLLKFFIVGYYCMPFIVYKDRI